MKRTSVRATSAAAAMAATSAILLFFAGCRDEHE